LILECFDVSPVRIILCRNRNYEACVESKDTEVLNMYNIFNLQKPHRE